VLVAGHISFGETLEDCCKREVNEETGQIATSIKYIDSYVYPKKELLMVGFDSRVKKKAFNNSSEVDELEWFDLKESPKHLREGSIARQLVEEIINREKTDERD
jgi:NAD+ diphosphatase